MSDTHVLFGFATVGTKGQIVIPADARSTMQIKGGDKVVVVRGPREGSIIIHRIDSFDKLLEKAGLASEEREDRSPNIVLPTDEHFRRCRRHCYYMLWSAEASV
jgi:AbrB family looped-hinge helix DNA binding protein